MKKITSLFIVFLGISVFAQDIDGIKYSLEAKTVFYEFQEQAIIFLTLSNSSDNEIKHAEYGSIAERFFAYDNNGKKLRDSSWVEIIKRKKQNRTQISIPPKCEKTFMYTLGQLFEIVAPDSMTLKFRRSMHLCS